jgi:hypothetical protein
MGRRLLPKPSSLPDDLAPLPSFPGAHTYANTPLDDATVRSALWHAAGSVTRAARFLQVSPARLLSYVKNSAYLSGERDKAAELVVDAAEDVILDLLEDDDRREDTAKWVLDRKGAARGWGSSVKPPPGANITFGTSPSGQGMIAFKWQSDDTNNDPA